MVVNDSINFSFYYQGFLIIDGLEAPLIAIAMRFSVRKNWASETHVEWSMVFCVTYLSRDGKEMNIELCCKSTL
jgi:hypothetical protein